MASVPSFTSTPRAGVAQLNTANTDHTGATTTNIVDILTGAAAGTRINEIRIVADGNPADSIIDIFIYNGSNYRIFDFFDLGDPAASSTTVIGYTDRHVYDNLILPGSTWKIAASISVNPTSGNVNVWAFGGDLT